MKKLVTRYLIMVLIGGMLGVINSFCALGLSFWYVVLILIPIAVFVDWLTN